MSKHTPGPWSYERCSLGGKNLLGSGVIIAQQISFTDLSGFGMDASANASLIAAAPELLAALKKIIAKNPNGKGFPGFTEALVAIAKAEGRK